MSILSLNHIYKSFDKNFLGKAKSYVVDDVCFSIEEGETLGLIGMSGSGKTTIARLIMGLESVDAGEIYFNDITAKTLYQKNRLSFYRNVQMLYQSPITALNPRFTMWESLQEPLRLHYLGEKVSWEKQIKEVMEQLKLESLLLPRYPHELSGGQLQRICLARILLLSPKILVLDEPTSMLDVSIQADILKLLKNIKKEREISYIFITHDLEVAQLLCDTIAVLQKGKIVEQGTMQSVFSNPQHSYTKELLAQMCW